MEKKVIIIGREREREREREEGQTNKTNHCAFEILNVPENSFQTLYFLKYLSLFDILTFYLLSFAPR